MVVDTRAINRSFSKKINYAESSIKKRCGLVSRNFDLKI